MRRLLMLALVSTSAVAQTIDFRGVPMGGSEAALKKVAPFMRCEAGRNKGLLGDRVCHAFHRTNGGPEKNKFAGQDADYSASFFGDRLALFHVSIDSQHFDAAVAAMTEKFGKPSAQAAEQYTTAMGLSTSGNVVKWVRPDSLVEISQYGYDIRTTRIAYSYTSLVPEFGRRSDAAAKERAKGM